MIHVTILRVTTSSVRQWFVATLMFVAMCASVAHTSDFTNTYHALAERHQAVHGSLPYGPGWGLKNHEDKPLIASSPGDFYDVDFATSQTKAVAIINDLATKTRGLTGAFLALESPPGSLPSTQVKSLSISIPTATSYANIGVTYAEILKAIKAMKCVQRFCVGSNRSMKQGGVTYIASGGTTPGGGTEHWWTVGNGQQGGFVHIPCGPLYRSASQASGAILSQLAKAGPITNPTTSPEGQLYGWSLNGGINIVRSGPCANPAITNENCFGGHVVQTTWTIQCDLSSLTGSGKCYLKATVWSGGTAPVQPDGSWHIWEHTVTGGGMWSRSIGTEVPPQTQVPGGGAQVFSPFVIFACTFVKTPGSLPAFPPPAPPPPCPVGQGATSHSQSWVDNHQLAHTHDALDYGIRNGEGAGCGPCGGSRNDSGRLLDFAWKRFHRYRDQDQVGHFGPGVFSNFDARIQVDTASNTIFFWNAENPLELELTEGTTAGTYGDAKFAQIQSAELLDAAGAHATNDTTATWFEILAWDGTKSRFELFNLRTGDTTTRAGRLVRIQDRVGNAVTVSYSDAVSATDVALGHDRGRLWRMSSITDAHGKVATFTWVTYRGSWVVASITPPNGSVINYDYDRTSLIGLNRVRFSDGTVANFSTQADAANQLQIISIDDAGAEGAHRSKTSHVTWSAMDALTAIPGANATLPVSPNRVRMVKNGAGEVSYQNWGTTYGLGFVTYVYEGGKTASDPGILMRYETQGGAPHRISRATSFTVTGWQWSASSWEVVEEYGILANTRISRVVNNRNQRTSYNRNASGAITGETRYSSEGSVLSTSTTAYDAFQQPTLSTDRLGRQVQHTYDANGNRLTRKAAPTLPEESTWSWTYNGRGQPLTATDANGNVMTYVYGEVAGANDYKRLITIVEPADVAGGPQATSLFTYDSAGRLKTVTDAANRMTTYNYDTRNRLSSIVYADTTTETWTYGTTTQTANLLVTHKDRNNNLETSTYDNAGRRSGLTIAGPGGSPVVGVQSWTYLPGKSLVKTVTDNGEVITYGYDHHLRQITTTHAPRTGVSLTSSTAYDQTQRLVYTQDPYGRRTYYGYDRHDNISRVVREQIAGALTIPGNDAASILQAQNAVRVITPNAAYLIEEQVHDNEGQLTQRIDGRGYRSFFEYDAQGRLIAQVQSANLATKDPSPFQELVYGTAVVNGQTVSVALGYTPPDPAWFQVQAARTEYGYDDQGNRTLVIKPKSFTRSLPDPATGGFWSPTNQPYGTMLRVPDPTFTLTDAGYRTVTSYTGRNLVKSVTESPGTLDEATVDYTYTLTRKKATESDPRNSTWKTTYAYQTCCDRLSTVTDVAGKITTYTYDGNGNVLTVRDPNNVGVTNTYDPRNRPSTSTSTLNLTTTYTYDDNLIDGAGLSATYATQFAGLGLGAGADGSAVRISNPLGEVSLEVRDGVGRTVRRIDGNLNTTTAIYDVVAGSLIETQVVDALGNTTKQQADSSGRVRVSVDAAGQPTTALFDANGNQVSLRDPNNVGWTTPGDDTTGPGYDLMNRLRMRIDTHGDVMEYAYDLHGNTIGTMDALSHVTTCAYDYRDRKAQCTDRVGGVTTYTYDKANHLIKIADADSATNGVTDYTYDNRGLLESETFPVGVASKRTRRTYSYDNGKRLWTRAVTTVPAATPALNEVTTYGYDLGNRLTSRTYNDGLGNDTFAYDNANRLTQGVSGRYGATVDRGYTGNAPAEKAGRLTSETLTLSGMNAGSWLVKYAYDAANRLTTLTYPTNDTSVRSYTPRNQLQGVTFAGTNVATRTYDNGGRLSTTTLGNNLVETRTYRSDANGVDNQLATQAIPGVTNFSYTYDANKRITQETNGLFANQTQQFLAYDHENRLTNWQRGTDTQSWLLSKVGDWQSTTINGVAQNRTHSAVHEISTVGAVPLSYDLKGNLTQNLDGALYGWDSENRLTSATVTDTDYGVNDTATYRYDALGRRVQKTVYGMVTTFIHAGAQVIHEFDAKIQLPAASANDDGNGAGTPPGGGILQGAGVTRFNYQPSLSPIPPGFYADKGKVYGVRSNGKSYGWLTTARTDTVIRNQHPYPQFDTFNQAWLNNTGTAGTWEIALPNGTYAVVVVAGDPASANQTNNVTIEGQGQIDPDPAVATPPSYRRGDFDGYAVTANVTDGRLTLSVPGTANNPKLCFIEIGAQGSSITQADRDRLAAAIEDASSDTGLPAFPKAQPSPRQYVYGSYVDEPLLMRAAGNRYYYASNRLYSVAAITTQAGQVAERYKYDAYGKQGILADNGVVAYKPSDYGQFHGYTGRYHDYEKSLIYFRARQYDPALGGFANRDKAMARSKPTAGDGYQDGMSLYRGYFSTNGLDPSGLRNCSEATNPINVVVSAAYASAPSDVNLIGGNSIGSLVEGIESQTKDTRCNCIKRLVLVAHGSPAGLQFGPMGAFTTHMESGWLTTGHAPGSAFNDGEDWYGPYDSSYAFSYNLKQKVCFCPGASAYILSCNVGLGELPQRLADTLGITIFAPNGYCVPNVNNPGASDIHTHYHGDRPFPNSDTMGEYTPGGVARPENQEPVYR